ncbi:MAG: hypothetical protein ABI888_03550 [Chloroflexota bacterium]
MITDDESWRPTRLRAVQPAPAAAAFVEDEEIVTAPPVAAPVQARADTGTLSASERLTLMEELEREALAKRFKELDRRSEEQAAEQQRLFAERLDAAIAAALEQLRERRQSTLAELEQWAIAERKRVTGDLAAEEQRFSDRLMRQLSDFEQQLGERLREQEQKLAGWWSEAERLADDRMRIALRDVNSA